MSIRTRLEKLLTSCRIQRSRSSTGCTFIQRASAGFAPYIWWFGEVPSELVRIFHSLNECTIFMAVGTSGVVEPAVSFVARVTRRARTIYVGAEEPANASAFTECQLGKAGGSCPTYSVKVCVVAAIAASRIRLWLASEWGRRGRGGGVFPEREVTRYVSQPIPSARIAISLARKRSRCDQTLWASPQHGFLKLCWYGQLWCLAMPKHRPPKAAFLT